MSRQAPDKCSHGKMWSETCTDCDAVSHAQQLRWLIDDLEKAAEHFERRPADASCPSVTSDLYRSIGRLAKIIAVNSADKAGEAHD